MRKHEVYKKRDVKKASRDRKNSSHVVSYGMDNDSYFLNEESIDINSFSTPRKKQVKKQSALKRFWNNRKKWQKILIIVLLSLVLVATSVFVVFEVTMGKIGRDDDFNNLNKEDLGIDYVIDENVYNIALFGIDTRDVNGTQSNSDSIMILSLNKNDNTIRLVSIMRDSFVPTEHNGQKIYAKINSAYSYGGPANAVKTINKCFGLDISEYATVNFFGMADIIDAVGGIYCNVTYDEIHCKISINEHIRNQCSCMGISPTPHLVKKEGNQLLNGIQAVAYARIRYAQNWQGTSNDFGRTERQRYVMQQLLDKALDMNVAEYPSLVNKLAPFVKTSFSNSELVSLASFLVKKPQMVTSRVPCDEYIINSDFRPYGGSTVYYNYEFAGKVLRAFLYDGIIPEDYMAQNGVDKTGWFGGGSGSSTNKKTNTVSSNKNNNNSKDNGTSIFIDDDEDEEEENNLGSSSVISEVPQTESAGNDPPETSVPTEPTQSETESTSTESETTISEE